MQKEGSDPAFLCHDMCMRSQFLNYHLGPQGLSTTSDLTYPHCTVARASCAQEDMKALAGPTGNAPPGPDNGVSLSFEAGFGSVEQRALVEDFEMHASKASRLLLKAGVVTETQVSQYVDSALLVGSRQRVVV